jgi:hypothetical protein
VCICTVILPPGGYPIAVKYIIYHSAAGRNISLKNSNDTIVNGSRNLPACSSLPQPTAPPIACPHSKRKETQITRKLFPGFFPPFPHSVNVPSFHTLNISHFVSYVRNMTLQTSKYTRSTDNGHKTIATFCSYSNTVTIYKQR